MNEPKNGVIQNLFIVANTSGGHVKALVLNREQQRLVIAFLRSRHSSGIPVTGESITGLGVTPAAIQRKVA